MRPNTSSRRLRFDQSGCAHAWAHQHTASGSASNLFFEGRTIYSYGRHFPIATLDGLTVYFTTQSYSVTTACHISIVRSAISHKRIIYVHELPTGAEPKGDDRFKRANIDHWVKELHAACDEYAAHPRRKSLLFRMRETLDSIRDFIDALELQPDKSLDAILNSSDIAGLQALFLAQAKKEEVRKRRQAGQLKKKFLQALTEWENYRRSKISYDVAPDALRDIAWLRLKSDGSAVETSKGVEVSLPVAERFYRFIRQALPPGCMGCAYSILGFKVDKISADELVVGCHTVPMSQVDKIARELDWDPSTPGNPSF